MVTLPPVVPPNAWGAAPAGDDHGRIVMNCRDIERVRRSLRGDDDLPVPTPASSRLELRGHVSGSMTGVYLLPNRPPGRHQRVSSDVRTEDGCSGQ